jgi:hypothetical protein
MEQTRSHLIWIPYARFSKDGRFFADLLKGKGKIANIRVGVIGYS